MSLKGEAEMSFAKVVSVIGAVAAAFAGAAAHAQDYHRQMYESGPMGTPPAMSTAPLPYGVPPGGYPYPSYQMPPPPPLPAPPTIRSYVPEPPYPQRGYSTLPDPPSPYYER